MVKVRLIVSRAGTGFAQSAGDVIEVSDQEAKRMIAAEQAVPVRGEKPRTATRQPVERAVEDNA